VNTYKRSKPIPVSRLHARILSVVMLTVAWGAMPRPAMAEEPTDNSGAPSVSNSVLKNAYVLGPEDELSIWVANAEEITGRPIKVGTDGFISVPLAGRVQAAGLTVAALEAQLVERLKSHIREPEVALTLAEPRSQPVSVLGSVNKPGAHQLRGRKTLVEMLSAAEGIRPDAGYTITIVRQKEWGRLPLANAQDDPTGRFTVATVNLKSITDATNPADNIQIQPHDIITVPKADMVYVIGEVAKAGGFVLQERETLTVLEAVSLAGGLGGTASAKSARILRRTATSVDRTEVPVNVAGILAGTASDVRLQPDDILFVPTSQSKRAAIRTLETAIQLGTGLVIWRR
jgi:polysaccharide biosynthesis/export protein